jgi:SWI/SNF chromatin-remodeling complex subunit SWI1
MLSVDSSIFAQNPVNGISYQNHHHQQQQITPQQTHTPNPQQPAQNPQQFPYQVPSVVPSKRPRPGEDAVASSTGQPPVTMNLSRSQTPQQVGPFPSPYPYQQHLQATGSSNATPSPTMQNQQFRPPSQAQRMQTVSPNPQFPQQQQHAMSMSPPPDANGRMTPQTPQFNVGGQMQGQMPNQMGGQMGMAMQNHMQNQMGGQMGQQVNPQIAGAFSGGQMPPGGFNPNFGGMQGMNISGQQGFSAPVNLSPNIAAQQAEVQRQYQLKMQQQQQMSNMQRQSMQQAAMNRMIGNQQPNMGTPTRPPQQVSPQQQLQQQSFINQVKAFSMRSGRHFDENISLHGRPVNLFALFKYVIQNKGSKTVTTMNIWPKIAAAIGFIEPNAGMELKEVFERSLGSYEAAYWQNHNQKRMESSGQGMSGQQMSPNRSQPQTPQSATQQQTQMMPNRAQGSIPPEQMTPVQANAVPNGWPTPQIETPSMKGQNLPSAQRKSIGRPPEESPAQARQSPSTVGKPQETPKIPNGSIQPDMDPKCYQFGKVPHNSSYGGIAMDALPQIGHEIATLKPVVPDPSDMGLIDIRAISLSLQSGIRSEVRYALDVLIKMTGSAHIVLLLDQSEDLLDTLIDCAEAQLEILQQGSPDTSDVLHLSSYEDVSRNARSEFLAVQELPEAGTLAYDADRAAEKLLAITTILRNLSFTSGPMDKNAECIASNVDAVKFISNAIRLVGTRNMLLRTHIRTLEFMKDIVITLSNTADLIKLPSKEDAVCLLNFLLAFAPNPDPTSLADVRFSFYVPRMHRYFPPAIDSLTKLMLVDDPNRHFFKSIFADPSLSPYSPTPASSSDSPTPKSLPICQQYALLTRAFGLAIAVLPDRTILHLADETMLQRREATLSQGLLAADILSGLLPTSSSTTEAGLALARAWLASQDCWLPSLINFFRSVLSKPELRSQEQYKSIVNRGLTMLRRLAILGLGKTGRKVKGFSAFSVSAIESVAAVQNGDMDMDGGENGTLDKDKAVATSNGTPAKDTSAVTADGQKSGWDGLSAEALPNWGFVIGALNMHGMDPAVLRNLIALAGLDE